MKIDVRCEFVYPAIDSNDLPVRQVGVAACAHHDGNLGSSLVAELQADCALLCSAAQG